MLELRDIRKSYRLGENEVHALRGVSITIERGDYVAIMGPSGSGKSTLLSLLGLLDTPDAGSYRVDGKEAAGLSEDDLALLRRETIGFVFQQFHLLSRQTAIENVALPLLYSEHRTDTDLASGLLGKVGLGSRMHHRPNELSGGQQQRVAIARALVNHPRLILADEPTGNLDSKSEKEILELFDRLNEQGITLVVVTHEEEVGQRARRCIRMRDGEIQSDERRAPIASVLSEVGAPVPKTAIPLGHFAEAREYARQGFRTLAGNKVRTALSMLGILMGVAAVVAMLAIGRGAQKDVEAQIASMGSNLLVLRSGAMRVGGVAQEAGETTRITLEDVETLIERVSAIKDASPAVEGKVHTTYQGKNWQTQILGVGPSYVRVRASEPYEGRFFNEYENRKRQRVALLGATVARELFGNHSAVGEKIRINRMSFVVIGVLPAKGASGWRDQDDVVLVPVLTAMHRVLGKGYVDSVDLEVDDAERMGEAQARVREVMISRHRLGSSQLQIPFEIRNMAEVQAALSESSRTMTFLLASIAVISLLVGGIGIMNIMLVSVTERTREIGLRKAIGARRRDIMAQFLSESVVVTLVGGLAGIVLGGVGTFLVSALTGWSTEITLSSITLAFTFAVTIGVVFGIYPARKASALAPIAALRTE